jgi:hypothetical protein
MGTKTQKLSNVVDQIVEWQSVFTGDGSTGLTAVAGRGYFIDTTSGTVTVTLPASPKIGDIVQLKDYARTWGTNAVSTSSALFDGTTTTNSFSTQGQTITLVYMDGTKGWSLINEDTTTNVGATFVAATGGTVTTSGDYKIHTFTGDGCFVVSCAGNPGGSNSVDYLVVAGGGAGGSNLASDAGMGGGGGAGGFRESSGAASGCYSVSPLGACVPALPVSVTTYPVTVGAGGAGILYPANSDAPGNPGSNSIFSTITSTGGGGGGNIFTPTDHDSGANGGSGGGSSQVLDSSGTPSGGSGNTPPVSPPQGQPGGGSGPNNVNASGGGGGAGGAGANGVGPQPCGAGGAGGAGVSSSITGSPVGYAGGGGGAGNVTRGAANPVGGGGNGMSYTLLGSTGTANTGGGGGGMTGPNPSYNAPTCGSLSGGKGIVVIRYKFQ